MLQAPIFDGLSFDPFSLFDGGLSPAEVGVTGLGEADVALARQVVEAGLGNTFIPQLAIDAGLLSGRRIKAVLGVAAERRIALAWRTGSTRTDDFRALASAITTIMRATR